MASAVVSHAAGALTNVLSTAAAVTHLGKLNGALGFLSPTLLLAGHCAAVASMMKGRYSSPLLGLLQGLLFAYGGSILSSALLGSPTGNVLYADNKFVLYYLAAVWVLNHQPLAVVKQALDFAPLGVGARACREVLRARAVAEAVAAGARLFPRVAAPALAAGAVAGAGGSIAAGFVANALGYKAPFELATPTYLLRSSAVSAAAYYLAVVVLKALTAAEGTSLVVLAFLATQLADEVLGLRYDWTAPVVHAFQVATLQISPARRARGRPATPKAAGAAARTPRSKRA